MPRLPTMRVIGSQDISTSLRVPVGATRSGAVTVAIDALLSLRQRIGGGVVSGRQLRTWMPPFRFLVNRCVGEAAQRTDHPAIEADGRGGQLGAGWLVHEGHELVGETGHGAANADAADVGAAAEAGHPAALGNIALHHRAPTAQFHDALGRAILARKVALLIVARPVAA